MTKRQDTDADDARLLADLVRRAIRERTGRRNEEWQIDHLTQAQKSLRGTHLRGGFVWGIGGATATALALLLFWAFRSNQAPAPSPPVVAEDLADRLSYAIEPESQVAATKQRPTAAKPDAADLKQPRSPIGKRYLFSDGTSVSLSGGGVLEIVDTQSRQPRLRVARGESFVKVIHRPDTHWTFAAGPFNVDVVGTSFDLAWDPTLSNLSLRLHEGAVDLRGPTLREALRVRAGQTVLASARTGQLSITDDAAPPVSSGDNPRAPASNAALEPTGNAAGAPAPIGNATRTPSGGASAATAAHSFADHAPDHAGPVKAATLTNWRTLVARGQFDQVIAQAQARPLGTCLGSSSSEELRALGDAARYSNRTDIAERAFRALRQRFGGSSDGIAAAFLLGRTYESKHQREQAGRWYSRYLAEAPEGEFAVEAAAGRTRVADMR